MPDVSTQSRPDYMGVTRIASEIGQVACGDGTAADGYGRWEKFMRRRRPWKRASGREG
jgi:hypothetical protein